MSRPKVRDDVALMEGYHSPQVNVAVRLNTNEAPEPPPAAFTEALQAGLASIEWHRYPDRSAVELRSRIAELESHEVPGGITAANVLAANGSNEVLQSLCLAYGGAGRRVLTFEPTYAMHSHIAKVCGSEVLVGTRADDFTVDAPGARRLIFTERPAITFLCSPNNPTGCLEPPETVRAVLDAVEEVDGLLVVDEAYGQFSPWSAMSLVAEDRSIVVTRTYSKTWSAAALRLGYLVGPTWLVDDLETVVLPYHLDAMTQMAGLLALDHLDDMRARVARLVEERGRVESELVDMDVDVWPSAANFILFRPRARDGSDVWADMVERSVLVRNCSSWPGLDGCLRVTLGTTAEDDEFLAALSAVLS